MAARPGVDFLCVGALLGLSVAVPGHADEDAARLELACFQGIMLTMVRLQLDGFLAYSAVSPDPRWAKAAAERIGIISIVPFFLSSLLQRNASRTPPT